MFYLSDSYSKVGKKNYVLNTHEKNTFKYF